MSIKSYAQAIRDVIAEEMRRDGKVFIMGEDIAEQGGRAYLVGTGETLTVLRNGRLEFLPEAKGYISIFAVNGPAYGVTLTGLKYPLDKYYMLGSYPIGVSNEFTGQPSSAETAEGSLLIIFHSNNGVLPIANPF